MCCVSILHIINSIILEINYQDLQLKNSYLGIRSSYLRVQTPEKYKQVFSNLVNNIQDKFDQHQNSKAHERLAGQIKHEYFTSFPNELDPFISEMSFTFHQKNSYTFDSLSIFNKGNHVKLQNGDLWVNFQQKYEYNPIHNHSGVLSWVYYHKIPYSLEEEDKYFNDPSKTLFNGRFVFHPTIDQPITLDIDNKDEGTFIMFPSLLHHSVYPFYTSDEYRITIAGNVGFNLNLDKE